MSNSPQLDEYKYDNKSKQPSLSSIVILYEWNIERILNITFT